MPARTSVRTNENKGRSGFTEEERAAMRARVREARPRGKPGNVDGEAQVREAIAAMQPTSRAMAERLHAIIRATAPGLVPRTWYGMPAYSKDDQVVCYFRPPEKFKTRYATLGFSDEAKLDEGQMWPTDFALTGLDAAEESRIVALLKRAVG